MQIYTTRQNNLDTDIVAICISKEIVRVRVRASKPEGGDTEKTRNGKLRVSVLKVVEQQHKYNTSKVQNTIIPNKIRSIFFETMFGEEKSFDFNLEIEIYSLFVILCVVRYC